MISKIDEAIYQEALYKNTILYSAMWEIERIVLLPSTASDKERLERIHSIVRVVLSRNTSPADADPTT